MTFAELLQEYNIDYLEEGHEHCRDGWLQLDCPRCTKNQQHYRLGYNVRFGYMNCWLCGKMRPSEFLREMTNIPWKELQDALSNVVREVSVEKEKVTGTYTEPFGVSAMLRVHREYLRERGFPAKKTARLWEVGGIGGTGGRLDWRLFIPVIYKGRRVSWTTRHMRQDHTGRYISARPSEETHPHKHLLYGEDYARNGIIIVEAPTDVWNIGPGAVATFGTDYTPAQLEKMTRYPTRVICYDPTPDAQAKAKELRNSLSVFPGQTINVFLDADDPGEASDEEVRKIRQLIGG